jgi:hypothetical protein
VFNPGRVSINTSPINKPADEIQQLAGAYSSGRNLAAALMAAGGVRPDADLTRVMLKREGVIFKVDITSVISSDDYVEMPQLSNGDHILVYSSGKEASDLIRPSQITPPGMRVFISNLTSPTNVSTGTDATRLPYGASLIDVMMAANCGGGTASANASRSIVLITKNHGAKNQIAISRSINQLLRNTSNPSINPYIMPNDALACYDSRFTNFRDVARGLGDLLNPFFLGRLL